MVKVKVCGITNLDDAKASVETGADAIGFIFAKSPRRVSVDEVKKIVFSLPPFIIKVGVFVNEVPSLICKIAKDCLLNVIQLHGEEIPEFCKEISSNFPVIKSIRVRNINDIKVLGAYKEFSSAFLLDTFVEGKKGREITYGGSGKTFNWDFCKDVKEFKKQIILAGGLNQNNVREAILKVKPYAVDVSGGVEKRAPEGLGKKDHKKLKEFIKIVKEIRL